MIHQQLHISSFFKPTKTNISAKTRNPYRWDLPWLVGNSADGQARHGRGALGHHGAAALRRGATAAAEDRAVRTGQGQGGKGPFDAARANEKRYHHGEIQVSSHGGLRKWMELYGVKCLVNQFIWFGRWLDDLYEHDLYGNHLPNDDWYEHDWVNGFFGEYAWNMINAWLLILVYDWVTIWISMWTFLQVWSPKGTKLAHLQLTRSPCKGDKFEIEIFEAKRQNAGISGTCQRMFATWTFISIGRRVTQVQKNAVRLRGESILFFECLKKSIRNLWFSSFPCKHPPDHPWSISAKVLWAKPRPQCSTRQERYHTPHPPLPPVDHKKTCATCELRNASCRNVKTSNS